MTASASKHLRCAIYTRKSSEEGLDQAFNSLDAQRQAGVDYIASQKHQGWTPVAAHYDDGGYSGGSTERPGLQRLLEDIAKGRVDVVVVYKVDRLSRSLADFARLMQTFDEHNVSFVSVTQQFNTTTSMGRLTLNMLLSFAQFEREVAGERIRDKIAATKKTGVWVCGQPPLGYRLPREGDKGYTPGDRVLRIIEAEAKLVRAIFSGYLVLGSLVKLAARLNAAGHTTKRWTSSNGRTHGGLKLSAAQLYRTLTNPIYTGKIVHTRGDGGPRKPKRKTGRGGGGGSGGGWVGGKVHTDVWDGRHEPIVEQQTWDKVQAKIAKAERKAGQTWTHTHLLKGKLRTFEGHAMSPANVQRPLSKRGGGPGSKAAKRLVRYYVSQKAIKQGYKTCPIKTINAEHLDQLVRALVRRWMVKEHGVDLAGMPPPARDYWVREMLDIATLAPDRVSLSLNEGRVKALVTEARRNSKLAQPRERNQIAAASERDGKASSILDQLRPAVESGDGCTMLTLKIQLSRLNGRRLALGPEGEDLRASIGDGATSGRHGHIVMAIGRAYAWRDELLNTGATIESIADREGLPPGHVHRTLMLTRLGPSVLKDALIGGQRDGSRPRGACQHWAKGCLGVAAGDCSPVGFRFESRLDLNTRGSHRRILVISTSDGADSGAIPAESSRKRADVPFGAPTDPNLEALITAWGHLPPAIRAGIAAMGVR